MSNHPNRNRNKGLVITAQGGVTFGVRLDGEYVGAMDYGHVDANHQYVGDDDEIIEAAREQFGISMDIPAVVR